MKIFLRSIGSRAKLIGLISISVLIGFAGGRILYSQPRPTSSLTPSDTSELTTLVEAEETAQSVPSTNANKEASSNSAEYLEVKEWGIKLKMQEAEKVTYAHKNFSYAQYGQEVSAITLTVRPEYLKDKSCNLSVDWTRYQKLNEQLKDVAIKIGEYYFVNGSQPNNCKNAEDNELYKRILSEFTNIEPL